MANEQVFDSIVDPIANKQVQSLTADLTALDLQAIDTAKSINQLNAATANSKTFADLTKNSAAVVAQQQKATDSIEKTRLAEIKLQQAREKNIDQFNKQNSAFALLNKQYQAAILNAKNIGAAQGVTSKAFIEATEAANKLSKQVDAINTPLGDFKNKVGSYSNAITGFFGNAFSKIRLLANIIPNFGVGTFFLLLGTGIVKLTDALGLFDRETPGFIKNLQNLNEVQHNANKDAGEQATNLKILYQAATDVSNSTRERIRAAQELKKEFPGEFKNASDLSIINGELSGTYKQMTQDILANAKARAAASKISELAAQQLDIDFEKEKIINAKRQDIANVKPSSRAQNANLDAVNGTITPAQQKASVAAQQQTLKDLLRGELEQADARKKALQDQIDFLTKFAGGNNKIASALSGDNTGTEKTKVDLKGAYNEQLKALKLAETAVLESEKSTYLERQAAVNNYLVKSYDLTKSYSDKGVLTQIEASNKFTEIIIDTDKQSLDLKEKNLKELADLEKEYQDQVKKASEDGERRAIEIIQKAGADKVLANEQNAADAIQALAEQYANGLITQKEYQKQLTAIQDEADIARLDQEIITAQAVIDVRKGLLAFGIGSAKELQSAEDKLANLKLQRTKAGTKAVLDGIKDETQARQELHQKEKELADESINLIKTAVEARYENQITALQAEADQVDVNAQKEKDQINNSLLSAKDKSDKTAIIDARTAADKQKIANQEKQVKIKEAEFDKAISIASIIENTAVAISKTLAEGGALFGIPLVPVIAALGAVQIATVLAQPIPAFKDGGTTKGGVVLWGEAGTELATLPDGSQQVSKGATIQTFPANTKITPHLELMKMLTPDKINAVGGQEIGWKEVLSQLKRMDKPSRRPVTKININGDFDRYRKSYFK